MVIFWRLRIYLETACVSTFLCLSLYSQGPACRPSNISCADVTWILLAKHMPSNSHLSSEQCQSTLLHLRRDVNRYLAPMPCMMWSRPLHGRIAHRCARTR
ncbi:hypothetical protein B0H19DRAFT_1191775, partial [Mycena capillaripes]